MGTALIRLKNCYFIEILRYSAAILIILLATPVMAVELFRYRGAAKDVGTLEYLFDVGKQNSPNAITK